MTLPMTGALGSGQRRGEGGLAREGGEDDRVGEGGQREEDEVMLHG